MTKLRVHFLGEDSWTQKRSPFLLIILYGLSTLPLLATQLDTLFSLSLEELMKIEAITTSKYKEQITDSPANVHVFSREQLLERGYRYAEDPLP